MYESLSINVLSYKVVDKSRSTRILAKCLNLLFDVAPSIDIEVSNLGAITGKILVSNIPNLKLRMHFIFKIWV